MKKLLSSLLVVMMLVTGQNMAWASTIFTDLQGYSWAVVDITAAVDRGVVAGVGNGRFEPARMVSREEFARMLVATFDAPQVAPSSPTFSDVAPEHWSYPAVETAKNFLTGYANPFGGLPAFHPTEPATREDIAVALVKMMGLSESDGQYGNYAASQFSDADQISPGLMGYINVAAEKGLIAGKGDGRFDPLGYATRAETVVLINRATKGAVADLSQAVSLDVQLIQTDAQATLAVTTDQGATVTVNGQNLTLTTVNGKNKGSYLHTFWQEGSETFTVVATKMGKKTTVTKTVTYQSNAPVLKITACPTTSEKDSAVISGSVSDAKDKNLTVTINGISVNLGYSNTWSYTVALKEGVNTFDIVAKNSAGKTTTERRTIDLQLGGPILTISNAPQNSQIDKVTLSGRITDSVDSNPTLTISGKAVNIQYGGYWSYEATLKEGKNKLTFIAKNKLGKITSETRTIEFLTGGPTLEITHAPQTSDKNTATISGRVTDINDQQPSLMINGKIVNVNYGGYWSYEATLKEGNNAFELIAKNKLGKSTSETRNIEFAVRGPVLEIANCPQNSDKSTVTLSGKITDLNDNYPSLMINGKSINVTSGGYWSYEAALKEGANTFDFAVKNKLGKTTSETRTIVFMVSGPVLDIIECPSTTLEQGITIRGKVTDLNDSRPSLTINGHNIGVDYSGYWSYVPTLQTGSNTFEITVKNKLGKTASETRIIELMLDTEDDTE